MQTQKGAKSENVTHVRTSKDLFWRPSLGPQHAGYTITIISPSPLGKNASMKIEILSNYVVTIATILINQVRLTCLIV
jgi:hypothetical protein